MNIHVIEKKEVAKVAEITGLCRHCSIGPGSALSVALKLAEHQLPVSKDPLPLPAQLRFKLRILICWNDKREASPDRDDWLRRARDHQPLPGDPDFVKWFSAAVTRLNDVYAGRGPGSVDTGVRFLFSASNIEHVFSTVINNDWEIPKARDLTNESLPPLSKEEIEEFHRVRYQNRSELARKYPGEAVVIIMDGSKLIWNATKKLWQVGIWGGGESGINADFVRTFPPAVADDPNNFGNHLAHEFGHFFSLPHTFNEKEHDAVNLSEQEWNEYQNEKTLTPQQARERLRERIEARMAAYLDKHSEVSNLGNLYDGDSFIVLDTPPDPSSYYFELLQPDTSKPFPEVEFHVAGKPVRLCPQRFNAMSYYGFPFPGVLTPGQAGAVRRAFLVTGRTHLVHRYSGAPVLFYNQANGQWSTGVTNADGHFDTVFISEPGPMGVWTQIVGAGNNALLFYNRSSGQWSTGITRNDGSFYFVFTSAVGSMGQWTHIASAGNGTLLFYNQGNGQWSTGVMKIDGSFNGVFVSKVGSMGQWTHITGAGNGTLLFYNQGNGQWSTGVTKTDGSFDTVFISKEKAMGHWTHIVGAGNGALFFYNRVIGQWSTGVIKADGSFDTVFISKPGSMGQWTHITGTNNGTILFYNKNNGQWSTAILKPDGSFDSVFVSEVDSMTQWTHVSA